MSEKSFFLIWCPSGESSPQHRHDTFSGADREAVRLALTMPDKVFYIVEAVRKIEISKIQRTDFERNDEVPF